MDRNSAFYRKEQPQQEDFSLNNLSSEDYQYLWDVAAKGAWKQPHLTLEERKDQYLGPQQWLAKYPGKTMQHYRAFKEKVRPKKPKPNWLQGLVQRLIGIR